MENKKLIKYLEYIINWIKSEVKKANAKGVILGLSGGIDSAVVGALGKKAFPNNSLAIIMPINKMGVDYDDALSWAKQIQLKTLTIDLSSSYKSLTNVFNLKNDLSLVNIKPRLRMLTLYAYAQEKNYLVLGTGNLIELSLGYFTKFGDGAADLLPLVYLTKTNVYQAANYFKVLDVIIKKSPTSGLWENGKTDEEELGMNYQQIEAYFAGKEVKPDIQKKLKNLEFNSNHKRDMPIKPKKFIN